MRSCYIYKLQIQWNGLPKKAAVHSHEKLIAWICAFFYSNCHLFSHCLRWIAFNCSLFTCILLFDKFDATESEMMISMCTNYGNTNMNCLLCKLIKWNCIYCLHTKWMHMFHSSEWNRAKWWRTHRAHRAELTISVNNVNGNQISVLFILMISLTRAETSKSSSEPCVPSFATVLIHAQKDITLSIQV